MNITKDQILYLISVLAHAFSDRQSKLDTGQSRTELLRSLTLIEKYVKDSQNFQPNADSSKQYH